jgi:hypothetical protein
MPSLNPREMSDDELKAEADRLAAKWDPPDRTVRREHSARETRERLTLLRLRIELGRRGMAEDPLLQLFCGRSLCDDECGEFSGCVRGED